MIEGYGYKVKVLPFLSAGWVVERSCRTGLYTFFPRGRSSAKLSERVIQQGKERRSGGEAACPPAPKYCLWVEHRVGWRDGEWVVPAMPS